MIARRLIVRGRVQGVFYRNWTMTTARSLKLTGWVRNLSSGEVEILAVGPQEAIEDLEQQCRRGPYGAKVEEIITSKAAVEPLASFEKRPTA